MVFSFKINTDSFVTNIYYNICMLFYLKKKTFFRKIINWEQNANFNLVLV